MAEAMNYRMNLVIDPKNVIKANRELRAMERYFERIQGRVLQIGRTRMAPEIVLKDRASKGLDNLLAKINRVKSQVINASGNVKVNVRKQIDTVVSVNVRNSTQPVNFNPVVTSLQANTDAVRGLTDALGNLQLGGSGKESNSFLDKALSFATAFTTFGLTMKSIGEIKGKKKRAFDEVFGGNSEETPIQKHNKNSQQKQKKNKRKQNKNRRQNNSNNKRVQNTAQEKQSRKGRLLRKAAAGGDFIETVGNIASSGIKIAKKTWDFGKDLFGGGGNLGIVAGYGNSTTRKSLQSPKTSNKISQDIGSSMAKTTTKTGVASGLLKGAGKRILGPLSLLADASAIAKAEPGKERNQAIGSAVGGGIGATIGGAIGSVIPVAGTLVGSTVGGAVGSFVGEKIGGAVTGITETFKAGGEKVSKWFSNTFSFGKKKKDVVAETKPAPKPAAPAVSAPSAMIANPAPAIPPGPAYGPALPYSHSSSRGSFGPPTIDPARSQAYTAGKQMSPQVVQISPEQMSALSGLLRDIKAERTTNYNLPPGAVQVTVHEEHPVDVEGLILQVGQRLRAELMKASQNRKPAAPMPY